MEGWGKVKERKWPLMTIRPAFPFLCSLFSKLAVDSIHRDNVLSPFIYSFCILLFPLVSGGMFWKYLTEWMARSRCLEKENKKWDNYKAGFCFTTSNFNHLQATVSIRISTCLFEILVVLLSWGKKKTVVKYGGIVNSSEAMVRITNFRRTKKSF